MRKDPTEFRKRFAAWKNGEQVYKDGLPAYRGGKDSGKINYSRWDNAELTSYPVPFIDEKRITLTNAGRATGAVLSTNLLDSIADNADRAWLPLQTALGLAVKESTLGNPTDDRTAWDLSSGIRRAFNNKYPGTEQHINYWGDALNEREDVINYHKGRQSDDPASGHKSVLQEAFEFYKQHPDKYNTGQKDYQMSVDKRGVEVMQSPEVQKWLKERNIKKVTGRFNRLNPILNESKFNLPKYAGGKIPEYVQAGTDNSWTRVTNDPMGAVFQDLVVRPQSRGGNTTVGNWKRLWSPKYEKPLETVYPEFDIISGIRGIINTLKPKSNNISTVLKDVDYSHDIAKTPYVYSETTAKDLAKHASSVYDINKFAMRAKIEDGHPVAEAYKKIKTFLESPEYRERLIKYYRDKGSSIITQNNAPDDRIGEQLYNLSTAKFEVRPRGNLIDSNGLIYDSYGLYDPETHLIQVANDAMSRQTPIHEMWHATRKARPYLDNAKYSMRTTAQREIDNMFEKTLPEEFSSQRIKQLEKDALYYSRIEEQEARVLDTLREMQEEGLDINKLTDDQIFDFLYNRPIDSHGTNVQSLIDNYLRDDIPNALRNFKSLFVPAALSSVGYGTYNKYRQ